MQLLHHSSILLLGFIQSLPAAPFVPAQHVVFPPSIDAASAVHDALKHSSIIFDVLNDFEPSYSLSVSYPGSHESVRLGNDIPVASVSSRPAFELHPTYAEANSSGSSNKTFTVILTDPDAKSRDNPKWSEMCHWILTNVTAPIRSDTTVLATSELIEYLPPSPPPKTGKHRYVFVLLEGSGEHALSPPKARKHWGYGQVRHGVRDWAQENGLSVVGANFFYAQHAKQ